MAEGDGKVATEGAAVFLNSAAEVAEGMKEQILDKRLKKARGSAKKSAALTEKLERIARLQGGPIGAERSFLGRTAAALQAGNTGPSSVSPTRRTATATAQMPGDVERAAQAVWDTVDGMWSNLSGAAEREAAAQREADARRQAAEREAARRAEEQSGVARFAMQGLAWAGKALFGEAPPAPREGAARQVAPQPGPQEEGRSDLMGWAGKMLFGPEGSEPVQQPVAVQSPEAVRADQWARINAIEERHQRLIAKHDEFMEKLKNF